MLGGCSVLTGEEGSAAVERPPASAVPPPQAASVFQGAGQDTAADSPGWNLRTLESVAGMREADVLTLEQAWRLAVLHDPNYQAALSARAAAETERRQGRAAILPQVQAGYSRSRITGEQTQYDMLGRSQSGDLSYDSTSMYIQLQQPVINMGRYAEYRGGIARAELGKAEFHEREQSAALSLAEAYLEALRTESQWRLAGQLAESLEAQARAQDRLYEANEGDRIDAQETRARLALARSEEIRTRDARDVALRELESMIGRPPGQLAGLTEDFEPARLPHPVLQGWLAMALQANPAVAVARESVRVAETRLQLATSRHLPSLDLVAGYSRADSENLSSLSQRSNTWTVGLNASIPLFSGGYDSANRAQASAELDQARQELRAAEEVAAAEATRQYTAIIGGEQRIRALRTAVESSQHSLRAAQESYRYGIRSNVDVLRSQDRLYESRSQLSNATIEYLRAVAALSAATGRLGERVFEEMSLLHLVH